MDVVEYLLNFIERLEEGLCEDKLNVGKDAKTLNSVKSFNSNSSTKAQS